ncbi:MAG: trigger factor [Gammaproteobacteria bacterium]|nr:trigger factor [Gammaproteobacteria bacterium]|tara:strand:- start:2899 stop:4188 length:1290 start_codon:yes stop_codon:yes gene_type:complete
MVTKIKNLKGLEKELVISFDSKDVEPTVDSKLLKLSKTLDLKGFRKGKVPMNVVKSKYYNQCFNESLSEHIEQNYIKVILDEKLNPAGPPKISMEETKNKDIYTFKALIEVMPNIELKNIDKIKLEKPVLKVKKEDLEKAVDKIADQYKEWKVVKRKSKKGDRVKADFVGKINGEEFENNKANDFFIEIGSNQLIPGFEEGLKGVKAGEEKVLDIVFPDDYQDKKLAAKPVTFDIKIKEVSEAKVSEINEDFIKKLGIKDGKIESLYSKIEEGMKKDSETLIESYLKKNVISSLSKLQKFEVPKSLIHDEILRIEKENNPSGDVKMSFEDMEKLYLKEAENRVKAGLLLREIINKEKFSLSKENIDNWLDTISRGQGNRAEIENYYMNNEDAKKNMESVILENLAVKWVIKNASVNEKNYTFDDLVELR